MSANPPYYLTVPEMYRLTTACIPLANTFDHPPYLVGSATVRRDFRDVDVRLIFIDDDEFTRRFPDRRSLLFLNALVSEQLARSTGLPIDFQFQSFAEAQTHEGKRLPLGISEAIWSPASMEPAL